jgi:hypothetical protein
MTSGTTETRQPRRYNAHWIEDDGQALAEKLDEIGKANERVISVIYRPATEERRADEKPWPRPAQFVIITERDNG